jgi:hypothetical protein
VTAAPQLWIVEGIRPWSAAGPGWANAGLTLVVRHRQTGEWRTKTIYTDAMTREQHRLFRVALSTWGGLRGAFGSASSDAWMIEWDGTE